MLKSNPTQLTNQANQTNPYEIQEAQSSSCPEVNVQRAHGPSKVHSFKQT